MHRACIPILLVLLSGTEAATVDGIVSVTNKHDSAEESVNASALTGDVRVTSSDLEIPRETYDQIVGITFRTVDIPNGAPILSANILFEIDEVRTGQTDTHCPVEIYGEATSSSSPFSESPFDLSQRTKTTATVRWEPEISVNVADPLTTADIATIVQEITSRHDWVVNNPITLFFGLPVDTTADGNCARWVESFNVNKDGITTPALMFTYDDDCGWTEACSAWSGTCGAVTRSCTSTCSCSAGCVMEKPSSSLAKTITCSTNTAGLSSLPAAVVAFIVITSLLATAGIAIWAGPQIYNRCRSYTTLPPEVDF